LLKLNICTCVCCRCAAEATSTVTAGRAAVEHSALDRELAALKKQVRPCL
jgi:hypothetical protein